MQKVKLHFLFFLLMGFFSTQAQHLQIGDSLFAMGFYHQAIENYQKSDLDIKNFKIAKVYESQGDWNLAVNYIENYLAKDTLNTLVNFNYGKLLFQSKKYPKAISVFSKLTQIYENPTYSYFLGLSYQMDMNFIKANQCFEKVVQLDEFHLKANAKLVLFLLRSEKWNEANIYIDKICSRFPENIEFLSYKADYFYGISDYKNAVLWNQKLLDLGHQEKSVYEKIAMSWMR